MGLLQKLKSALGLDGTESSTSGTNRDVDVTVEREPSTGDEDAVKGTNTATTTGAHTSDTADGAGTEPGAGSETPPQVEESETAVSPTSTDGESSAATDASPADVESETAADDEDATETADEGSTAPVTDIKGIGPAYADRLADIGIETVGELAAADAADIAADTDLSESRISGWIERAEDF
jgi:predicted flap endonuclease-1-like 5' DNA nuclease